jgi:DNA (cytosine-5)-methyltransferase 1
MRAGWQGLFAVEKDSHAFETLRHNLIDGTQNIKYNWPSWLPKKQFRIGAFINKYQDQLRSLRGRVDLIVGGPPCQGFSLAGKRKKNDPRNTMFRHYVEMVELIRPPLLLLENVKGIDIAFGKGNGAQKNKRKRGRPPKAFSHRIREALDKIGYRVFVRLVKAMEYGVPQTRPRYFVFAIEKIYLDSISDSFLAGDSQFNPFMMMNAMKKDFLISKGLPHGVPVSVRDAISDLETVGKETIECEDSPRFRRVVYDKPLTPYQRLLHGSMNGTAPNSMRLAKHREQTQARFKLILDTCRRGVGLSVADRKLLGMKKHATVPLDGDKPSHTLTTLPDDLLHYSEPRILTVRENARLQSFPDWFDFKGNYTTGGKMRVRQCPRYTQVGNAVPPLLAELIGLVISALSCILTAILFFTCLHRRKIVQGSFSG